MVILKIYYEYNIQFLLHTNLHNTTTCFLLMYLFVQFQVAVTLSCAYSGISDNFLIIVVSNMRITYVFYFVSIRSVTFSLKIRYGNNKQEICANSNNNKYSLFLHSTIESYKLYIKYVLFLIFAIVNGLYVTRNFEILLRLLIFTIVAIHLYICKRLWLIINYSILCTILILLTK